MVLIKQGSVMKTTSGKIARQRNRTAYLNRKLQIICEVKDKGGATAAVAAGAGGAWGARRRSLDSAQGQLVAAAHQALHRRRELQKPLSPLAT